MTANNRISIHQNKNFRKRGVRFKYIKSDWIQKVIFGRDLLFSSSQRDEEILFQGCKRVFAGERYVAVFPWIFTKMKNGTERASLLCKLGSNSVGIAYFASRPLQSLAHVFARKAGEKTRTQAKPATWAKFSMWFLKREEGYSYLVFISTGNISFREFSFNRIVSFDAAIFIKKIFHADYGIVWTFPRINLFVKCN